MSAYEHFKKLGYRRKQNNKKYIEYVWVDKNYFNFEGEFEKDSKIERHIIFNKQRKSIELKEICYIFNVVHQKQVSVIRTFVMNEELLDAINEQFAEIKINSK